MTKQTQSLELEPTLPLDILQNADIERARRIRPTSFFNPEAASQPKEVTAQPEASSQGTNPQAAGDANVDLPCYG